MDMTTNMNDYRDNGLRWQSSALLALQEATEAFLVHLFEDACVYSSCIALKQNVKLRTGTYVLSMLNVLRL